MPDRHPTRDPETWWRTQARKTAWRINLAWWLDRLAAPTIITSALASVAILVWRNHGGDAISTTAAAAILALAGALAAACWLVARRRFESPAQSLVRIEASLGLHNALSTADAGFSTWPQPVGPSATHHAALRWHWRRLTLPPAVACASLIAALWMPIHHGSATPTSPPRQPLAWTQLDAELDALMESAVVEETYVKETRGRIEQLRTRDPAEWYSHNTMEATDSIAQAHRTEANHLEDALGRAQQAVERMQQADPDARERQFHEYQKAIDDMANGAMQPNDALRQQLAEIGPDNLNHLTREQFEKLREQLRDANDALRDAMQNSTGDPADPNNQENGAPMPGGDGPGEDGEHAPGVLGTPPDHEIEGGEFTPLAARDLSHAALGDLLEMQSSPHDEPDTSPAAPTQGGDTSATGRGGERIWRDALDPAEQRTLRKFFE
ncbi:MAG: hypothetical protein ACNA8L_01985 [Luteolibacter sp.]